MKRTTGIFLTTLCITSLCFAGADFPIKPVSFNNVQVNGGFWGSRIETNREKTLPYALQMCEETGRIDNFAVAGGMIKGQHRGYYFNDSDLFKVIEGASYSLSVYPDSKLQAYLDEIIAKIASAQEEDGYLYTARTTNPDNPPEHSGKTRWSLLRYSHELYNVGHLYEAAVAHYQATGKRTLLNVAINNADLLDRTFGPNKIHDTSGHEEIEIGLVKLYRATGNEKYLKLANFFIEQRGDHSTRESYKDFRQDHIPFKEQSAAVGHAVSGAYLYSGAADVAALTGNNEYIDALDRIWQDMTEKKLYITGVDAARGEKFGDPYKLPNLKGYNETCAAIAFAMWNHRMFLLHGDSSYIDMLERSIYNGIISGVSLQGNKFFYSNPLSSDGIHKFTNEQSCTRAPWFKCSCCPSNIARIIPSIPGYAYAVKDNDIYVNLYLASKAKIRTSDNIVTMTQQTDYPWNGKVTIKVEPQTEHDFNIFVRIPGWARNQPAPGGLYSYAERYQDTFKITVNGNMARKLKLEKGYARIPLRRKWNAGDTIEIDFSMPVRKVLCSHKVSDNIGKVALERGPVVYCVEGYDNNGDLDKAAIADDEIFDVTFADYMFDGVNVIKAQKSGLLAIPYYAWSHRGEGQMKIWLNRTESANTQNDRAILKAAMFKHHVDNFNKTQPENIVNYISDAESWDWIKANTPLFECPDKDFENIYYFRWWTFRKHIKKTEEGFVLTEFLDNVGHSGKYNTISCALGHHIYEGRWLRDPQYIDDYASFWYYGNDGTLQPHLRRYSSWDADAMYNRYLVNKDEKFIVSLLDGMIANFKGWEKDRGLENGMFWQYDVWDGMEESISGSRKDKNARPTINSYMYANAIAISKIAAMAGKKDIASEYENKSQRIKDLILTNLWDQKAKFFKPLHPWGKVADVREEFGLVPWYFNLPTKGKGYEQAWQQVLDPQGFKAPMGLMTAERRHPDFRSHGVGTCEWDGAVWPYATTQTLVAMANVIREYPQDVIHKKDYFDALTTYARSQHNKNLPYIGEYLDEVNGKWLTPDSDRSRFYNHSGFCDLVITGLAGLRPRTDDTVEVDPLVPTKTWDWFCVDNIRYHGFNLTIIWDKTGQKYSKGKGLQIFADGKKIAQSEKLLPITAKLP